MILFCASAVAELAAHCAFFQRVRVPAMKGAIKQKNDAIPTKLMMIRAVEFQLIPRAIDNEETHKLDTIPRAKTVS